MSGPAEPVEGPSFRRRFLDRLCGLSSYMFYMFVLEILLLLLALFSLLFVTPGSASSAILTIDIVIVSVALVGTSSVLYLCHSAG